MTNPCSPPCCHPRPAVGCEFCRLAEKFPQLRARWDALAAGRPIPAGGPGTELKRLLAWLGLTAGGGCGCDDRVRQMDAWGPAGCREHFNEIVAWLRGEQAKRGWGEKLKAAAKAVAFGLAFRLNPLDPLPGIIEEAIRRAERHD